MRYKSVCNCWKQVKNCTGSSEIIYDSSRKSSPNLYFQFIQICSCWFEYTGGICLISYEIKSQYIKVHFHRERKCKWDGDSSCSFTKCDVHSWPHTSVSTLKKKSTMNEIWTKVTTGCRNWKSSIFLQKESELVHHLFWNNTIPAYWRPSLVRGHKAFKPSTFEGFFLITIILNHRHKGVGRIGLYTLTKKPDVRFQAGKLNTSAVKFLHFTQLAF